MPTVIDFAALEARAAAARGRPPAAPEPAPEPAPAPRSWADTLITDIPAKLRSARALAAGGDRDAAEAILSWVDDFAEANKDSLAGFAGFEGSHPVARRVAGTASGLLGRSYRDELEALLAQPEVRHRANQRAASAIGGGAELTRLFDARGDDPYADVVVSGISQSLGAPASGAPARQSAPGGPSAEAPGLARPQGLGGAEIAAKYASRVRGLISGAVGDDGGTAAGIAMALYDAGDDAVDGQFAVKVSELAKASVSGLPPEQEAPAAQATARKAAEALSSAARAWRTAGDGSLEWRAAGAEALVPLLDEMPDFVVKNTPAVIRSLTDLADMRRRAQDLGREPSAEFERTYLTARAKAFRGVRDSLSPAESGILERASRFDAAEAGVRATDDPLIPEAATDTVYETRPGRGGALESVPVKVSRYESDVRELRGQLRDAKALALASGLDEDDAVDAVARARAAPMLPYAGDPDTAAFATALRMRLALKSGGFDIRNTEAELRKDPVLMAELAREVKDGAGGQPAPGADGSGAGGQPVPGARAAVADAMAAAAGRAGQGSWTAKLVAAVKAMPDELLREDIVKRLASKDVVGGWVAAAAGVRGDPGVSAAMEVLLSAKASQLRGAEPRKALESAAAEAFKEQLRREDPMLYRAVSGPGLDKLASGFASAQARFLEGAVPDGAADADVRTFVGAEYLGLYDPDSGISARLAGVSPTLARNVGPALDWLAGRGVALATNKGSVSLPHAAAAQLAGDLAGGTMAEALSGALADAARVKTDGLALRLRRATESLVWAAGAVDVPWGMGKDGVPTLRGYLASEYDAPDPDPGPDPEAEAEAATAQYTAQAQAQAQVQDGDSVVHAEELTAGPQVLRALQAIRSARAAADVGASNKIIRSLLDYDSKALDRAFPGLDAQGQGEVRGAIVAAVRGGDAASALRAVREKEYVTALNGTQKRQEELVRMLAQARKAGSAAGAAGAGDGLDGAFSAAAAAEMSGPDADGGMTPGW